MGQAQRREEYQCALFADQTNEVSREVWWRIAPRDWDHWIENESDVDWGWLLAYRNGDVLFFHHRPSPDQISCRNNCPMPTESEYDTMRASRRHTPIGVGIEEAIQQCVDGCS